MEQKDNRKQKTGRPARDAVVEILNRIDLKGAFAEPLLDSYLTRQKDVDQRDRGLITELVYGVLRNRNSLDWVIAKTYAGDFVSLETAVRNILRTAVYQLMYTERIPAFAAVNEAVQTAKKMCPAAAGLVNAVLRKTLLTINKIAWPDIETDPVAAVSTLYSHPPWLVERWIKQYSLKETIAICRENNTVPPLTIRINTLKTSRDTAILTLQSEGISAEPTSFSPEGLIILNNAKEIRKTIAFREGLFRVQDEASQLAAHFLDPRPGERVLDLCAGTGGKTLHVAALMHDRGEITAADVSQKKLQILKSEAKRLGVTTVKTIQENNTKRNDTIGKNFDKVLVDAPCSGLGTLRRNPEIRWRVRLDEIKTLKHTQKRLLQSAAGYVKPGGSLAYCVCTTTPEETDEVADEFLQNNKAFVLKSPPVHLPPALVTKEGFLRTYPHLHRMDGFFGALFVKKT